MKNFKNFKRHVSRGAGIVSISLVATFAGPVTSPPAQAAEPVAMAKEGDACTGCGAEKCILKKKSAIASTEKPPSGTSTC